MNHLDNFKTKALECAVICSILLAANIIAILPSYLAGVPITHESTMIGLLNVFLTIYIFRWIRTDNLVERDKK